jgi:hypothetical protein
MPDPHNERLEAELGRVLVAQLAPAELPLFGAMSRAFFADPKEQDRQAVEVTRSWPLGSRKRRGC